MQPSLEVTWKNIKDHTIGFAGLDNNNWITFCVSEVSLIIVCFCSVFSILLCLYLFSSSSCLRDSLRWSKDTQRYGFFCFFFDNMLPHWHDIMYATHPEQYWPNGHTCPHGAEKFSHQHKPRQLKDQPKKSMFLCGITFLGRTNTVFLGPRAYTVINWFISFLVSQIINIYNQWKKRNKAWAWTSSSSHLPRSKCTLLSHMWGIWIGLPPMLCP